jgi:transmembrane sensor
MDKRQHIQYLLEKFSDNAISDQETAELFSLLKENETLFETELHMLLSRRVQDPVLNYDREKWDAIANNITAPDDKLIVKTIPWKKWVAVASVLLLMGAAVFWYNDNKQLPSIIKNENLHDILPGSDRATLTLSDGHKIELANDQVITDGEINITSKNNQLVYEQTNVAVYNTMTTPKGGQYLLILPDGTKAWLNATSSITYPTAFKDRERTVNITGEVYLDVAKDPAKPFIVKLPNKTVINVLGTEFNVNCYAEEPLMNTTLVEGSIQLKTPVRTQLLKPGQQLASAENGSIKLITDPNIQQAVAWKKGVFDLENVPFDQVMRQFARWYDVEIEYPQGVPDIQLWGRVQRNLPLMEMLNGLGELNVKFKLNGRKLIVLK